MNIVFLIGNGFDLQMGLKTSYGSFLQWYLCQYSDNDEIKKFKDDITDEYELWANFELKLGEYTTHFTTPQKFLAIYSDVKRNLGEYLAIEQDMFLKKNRYDAKSLCRHLCTPEKSINLRDEKILSKYKQNFNINSHKISILTFNYTTIMSNLIAQATPHGIFTHSSDHYSFQQVLHIHGKFDHAMILGVNDVDQIKNKNFVENDDIKDCLVKPQSNYAVGALNDEASKIAIQKANLICLYGLSLGETDLYWWKLITEMLLEKDLVRLIIFYKDQDTIHHVEESTKEAKRREIKNRFISLTKADEKIKDKIFVEYDSDIFKSVILSSK